MNTWATSNKTVREIGTSGNTSTTWDDLRFPSDTVKIDPTNPPSAEAYKGGYVLAFASTPDQKLYFTVQLPHGYKLGTNLFPHIHYVLPTDGAGEGAENIKFDLTYSWSNIDGEFTDAITLPTTLDVQNSVNDTHYVLNLGEILNSNIRGTNEVSSMLLCSLTRDTSVANDYSDEVYLLEIDLHYQSDTIGSLNEVSKI